jgi:hypothetical protein
MDNTDNNLAAAALPASAPSLALHYAPARPRWAASVRRLLRPGSPGFLVLVLAVTTTAVWSLRKYQLRADEWAFDQRTVFNGTRVEFVQAPDEASLRHLGRLPGIWQIQFPRDPAPATPLVLRGQHFSNVDDVNFAEGVDVNPWLAEMARPDTGFKSLKILSLHSSSVTGLGLKELARPDSGLSALTTLVLYNTQVTNSDLRELVRPDCGLKALTTVLAESTPVTGTGAQLLMKIRPGLTVTATTNLAISVSADNLKATQNTEFSGTVATFTDTDSNALPDGFAATIDWRDGTESKGVVSAAKGGFTVTGHHTFQSVNDYVVWVLITDSDGNEAATVSRARVARCVPEAPTNVTARAKRYDEIELLWDVDDFDSTYDIFRSEDGTHFTQINTTVASYYLDSDGAKGLHHHTKYFYKVQTRNVAGLSGLSKPASATTDAKPWEAG